jgi:hypothetical protein
VRLALRRIVTVWFDVSICHMFDLLFSFSFFLSLSLSLSLAIFQEKDKRRVFAQLTIRSGPIPLRFLQAAIHQLQISQRPLCQPLTT